MKTKKLVPKSIATGDVGQRGFVDDEGSSLHGIVQSDGHDAMSSRKKRRVIDIENLRSAVDSGIRPPTTTLVALISSFNRVCLSCKNIVALSAKMNMVVAFMVQEAWFKGYDSGAMVQRLHEEEKAKLERIQRERATQEEASNATLIAEFDNVQARMEADALLAARLQEKEREQFSIYEQAGFLVETIAERKRFFAAQRAEQIRNKLPTKIQLRNKMITYLKNMGRFTYNQLKNKSFEEIQKLYEKEQKWIKGFIPMDSEEGRKKAASSKKRPRAEPDEESVKRQKIRETSGSGEEQSAKKEKELLEEELQKLLVVVPVEEVYVEALQVKYPIIDWEVYSEDTRRDGLVKLWDLVKKRFSTTKPTYDKEKELWVEMKRLFEPDNDYIIGHDIFMLVEKEYPLTRGTLGLMMVAKLLVEADSEMSRELLRKIFYQANRPRDDYWELEASTT
ncbi:hypothetical protein Tco_1154628 [Tanacetum coccineum]